MKKIKNIFLILIMIMPIFINASSNYYDSVDLSQKYVNNFKFHNNYLKYSSDLPWEYDGTKKENKNNFERGGLLNTWEYKVTTTGSETSISYLAPGIGYWLVSDGKPYNYLDIKLEKTSNEELLETRVCEFVKSDTTVEGKGSYGNPWYFKEGHLIAISSNNTLLGKITPNVKNYVKYDDVSEIAVLPNANYHFDDTKCKNKAKNISNYSLNNGIITIKNLINDLRCTIDFLPNEYKITLNKNGGTGGIDTLYEVYTVAICQSSDCKKENNIAKITVPTRVGYKFDGYYDSITGTSQIIDALGNIKVNSTYFKNDTTIYARWLANGHSITYALDGGVSGASAPTSGKYDEILTIDNPTKNITLTFSTVSAGATVNYTGSSVSASGKSVAYTFNGWNITGYDGSTAKMGSTNTTVTSSIISPTKNRYYKNLNSANNSSITFSATYNAPTIVLPKVTKSYYTCVWTSSGISDIASGGTYRPSSVAGATSRGFTASCSANTYTITLDRNGGTGGTSTLYEKYNTNYSLTSGGASVTNITVPTRAGYTFNGYYTASSGGTQLINASGNFTANLKNNSYTANATIYAQWTICPKGKYCPGNNTAVACAAGSYQDTTGQTTCKVCGNGKTSSTGATASSSCTDCSNKSNISSWKTTSWNTNNTMTNLCAINACATGYNLSNNTCVSKIYTITLDRNGGTGGTSTIYEKYNTNYSLTSGGAAVTNITVPTRAGYTFNGYYTASSGGTQLINASGAFTTNFKTTLFTANTTIYAQWTICPKGKYCPGNNTAVACAKGTYQDVTGQTTCKSCVTGSYQDTTGQTTCKVCGNGKTSSAGATAASSCTDCSNKSNISSWKTTSWNTNNTMTNLCAINACATGYNLSNNTCVSKIYTITLDRNGGTGGTSTLYEKYNTNYSLTSGGAAVTNITVPTRAGYTFNGYYTASSGGTQLINASGAFTTNFKTTLFTANTTIYAQWTICPKGKYCPGNNTAVACAKGTYQDVTGQTTCKSCVTGSYQDTTGQTTCKVCGNGKTSSAGSTASSSCTDCSNKSNISSWKATSWNTNNTMTNLCAINTCATGYNLSNNTCVSKIYTITLDRNGGSGGTSTLYEKYNTNYSLTSGGASVTKITVPTRAGYTFNGYYTASSGGTQLINASGAFTTNFKTTLFTANTTIYAQWTICPKGKYCPGNNTAVACAAGSYQDTTGQTTCKVCGNGKTSSAGATASKSCTDCSNKSNISSWKTTSWNTNNTMTNLCAINACATGYNLSNNNCVPKTFTVTFDPNGGSVSTGSKTVTYNSTYGTLPTPTKTNYTFEGWYTAASGGSQVVASTKVTLTANQTLYAQWKINYSFSFCYTGNYRLEPNEIVMNNGKTQPISYKETAQIYYGTSSKPSCSNLNNNEWKVWFLTSGNLTVSDTFDTSAFLIGGGASGTSGYSSGGAGGHITTSISTITLVPGESYPIHIGAGGTGNNGNGEATTAFNLTANGGSGRTNGTGAGATAGENGTGYGEYAWGDKNVDGIKYGAGGAGGGYCYARYNGMGTLSCPCNYSASWSYVATGGGTMYKAALANTGSGGGAGTGMDSDCGGSGRGTAGGSGIVIIKSSSSIVYNNTVLAKYTAGVKVSEDSNYLYVKLLNTGTLTLTQNKNVDIFMISGGQGGYDGNSTGGAGGRYVTKNGIALEKNVKYEVVIGQGGLSRTLGTDTSAFDYNTSKGNSTGVGGTASSGLSRGKAGTDGVLAFDGNYYGGGGAGGGYCGTSACKCSWSGSGSNNGKGSEGVINKSGGANTGGGGGSGSENACGLEGSQYTPGGPGGSGIVIIRLKK